MLDNKLVRGNRSAQVLDSRQVLDNRQVAPDNIPVAGRGNRLAQDNSFVLTLPLCPQMQMLPPSPTAKRKT